MFKKWIKWIFKLALYLSILSGSIVILARLITGLYAAPKTYSVDDAPTRKAAIIFGAGLWSDGSPTPVLKDRVQTGANLYFAGKVKKLLMSGDNRFVTYNEPEAMKKFALDLGVPEKDIVLDYAGRRTYDTCLRAKTIFQLDQVILVTQDFHLPRAIYTCNMLGIDGIGVSADIQYYLKRARLIWNLRELPATVSALIDLHVRAPFVVGGDPEPIFPVNH
jgi:SanA protein